MAVIKENKISFAGGEVAPALHHRFDMQKFGVWLKKALNSVPDVLGGFKNRSGFVFSGKAKFDDKECRLLPFEFNKEQAYCLEFGDGYVRVRDNDGLISDENGVVETASIFDEDGIKILSYAQSADMLFLANGKQQPQILKRYGRTDWRMDGYFAKNGPFMAYNTDEENKMKLTADSDSYRSVAEIGVINLEQNSYFFYVYWDDEQLANYSLLADWDEFITAFNNDAPRDLTCAYSGGRIIFTSPLTTPQEYNGHKIQVKVYKNVLRFNPLIVDKYAYFAGGAEDNSNISYILTAQKNTFDPKHKDSLFKIDTYLDEQILRVDLEGADNVSGTSTAISSNGMWRMITKGGWKGTVTIEVSYDGGKTWTEYRNTRSTDTNNPFNENIYGTIDCDDVVLIRLNYKNVYGYLAAEFYGESFKQSCVCRVVQYIDEKNVRVQAEQGNVGEIAFTSRWAQGSWSNYTGWPKKVFMFEGRLGFAATDSEPDTVWLSKTSDFWDFGVAREVQDDDAITMRALSTKLNRIAAIACLNKIFVFTAGNEFTISSEGALTQTSKQMKVCSNYGTQEVDPVVIGNKVLFIQKQAAVLRQFGYDYDSDGYDGISLSTVVKHLFDGYEIKQMAYCQTPDNILLLLRNDGVLLCLTYFPEETAYAWSSWQTDGAFESICVIPAEGYDQLYAVVNRNGSRTVERLARRLASKETQRQVFLDSCVIYDGQETAEMSGLEHLEGRKVNVLADGCVYRNIEVSEGKITLPAAHKIICAGLPYVMEVITLGGEYQGENGSTFAAKRRIIGAMVFYEDTCGFACGVENGIIDEAVFRSNEKYNNPIELKSGVKQLNFTAKHGLEGGIVIRQIDPLPLNVTAIMARTDYGN